MDAKNELARLVAQNVTEDGVHATHIPRLNLIRVSQPTEPLHIMHEPAFCIIAQGKKQVLLNDDVYLYDKDTYMVVSVALPVIGQVIEAEPETPYLGIQLTLDAANLNGLAVETGLDKTFADRAEVAHPGISLSTATPEVLDAATRLLRLLTEPQDVAVLAPLLEREILYRLLTGAAAPQLRQIALADSKLQQVSHAISWIKENYRKPFRADAVASEVRMSLSAFYYHFKAVTSMSPLQYQKKLRLQEARRLLLDASSDAATVGFNVGYDSTSQFSREYRRLFGEPPHRDSMKIRASQQPQGRTNQPRLLGDSGVGTKKRR